MTTQPDDSYSLTLSVKVPEDLTKRLMHKLQDNYLLKGMPTFKDAEQIIEIVLDSITVVVE